MKQFTFRDTLINDNNYKFILSTYDHNINKVQIEQI